MALPPEQYTLVGFTAELDWRPLHFVERIPAHRICNACGLLPRTTVFLPCRHVLCKTCYEQCLVNDDYECLLDGDRFRKEDADWREFPLENLLRRKVKCWNERNGCDVTMAASDIIRHFDQDCVHHSTRCTKCSAFVLCRDVRAHLRSNCSTHRAPGPWQSWGPSADCVQQAMFAALKTILEESAGNIKDGIDKIAGSQSNHCDKLTDVSHIVNALREAVLESSERQTRATEEAGIAYVREVKEELDTQHHKLNEVSEGIGALGTDVSQRMSALSEDFKMVVADATKQCLEKLDQSNAELKRCLNAAVKAKEMQRGHEVPVVGVNHLLARNTLSIKQYMFCVKGVKELKEKAMSTGWVRSDSEPIYLCGYRISPGLHLEKHDNSVSVHTGIQLHKGVIDEFLQWPFSHRVKLTFMHTSTEKHTEFLGNPNSNLECFGRPTDSSNSHCYWKKFTSLEDLEREGYVQSDQLSVKYEIVPI